MDNVISINDFKTEKYKDDYIVVNRQELWTNIKQIIGELIILEEDYPEDERIQQSIKEMSECVDQLRELMKDEE